MDDWNRTKEERRKEKKVMDTKVVARIGSAFIDVNIAIGSYRKQEK
jgi:hypothetical protein